MVDIRIVNNMSPGCQPCITFKFFKWHYIVLLGIWLSVVMITYVKHTSQCCKLLVKIFANLYKIRNSIP